MSAKGKFWTDPRRMYSYVRIDVDTSKLDDETETVLIDELERLKVEVEYYDRRSELWVTRWRSYDCEEFIENPEETQHAGQVSVGIYVRGRLPEVKVRRVYDILNKYDVSYE